LTDPQAWLICANMFGCMLVNSGFASVCVLLDDDGFAWLMKVTFRLVPRTYYCWFWLLWAPGSVMAASFLSDSNWPRHSVLTLRKLYQQQPNNYSCRLIFSQVIILLLSFLSSPNCMTKSLLNSIVGTLLVYLLDDNHRHVKLFGITIMGAFAVIIPFSMSLVSSNIVGNTKKTTVGTMLFLTYCTGNIISPQLFLTSQAPTYSVCCFLSFWNLVTDCKSSDRY
jgi:hypothetical protein